MAPWSCPALPPAAETTPAPGPPEPETTPKTPTTTMAEATNLFVNFTNFTLKVPFRGDLNQTIKDVIKQYLPSGTSMAYIERVAKHQIIADEIYDRLKDSPGYDLLRNRT